MSTGEQRRRRTATRELLSVWLFDHIGRASALFLGVLVVLLLIYLAAAGFTPALTLLVVLTVGVLLIGVGGRMRGGR